MSTSRLFSSGIFWLALCAAGLLAHHIWGYVGHFGFDDMHYARLSRQWADGTFDTALADHYTFRWGLIAPNGLMYRLWGMSDHSSAVLPLAAVLLTLALVWRLSSRLPVGARVLALVYVAGSEWVLFYSDKIMPDVLVMACVTGALFAIAWHRWGGGQQQPGWAAVGCAGSLLAGFLCKETVLLTLPLFGALLLADVWQGQRRAFWMRLAGWSLVGGVAYLLLIYALTGDAWGRFHSIAANSYFSLCSYDQLPPEHLWRRIGQELWRVLFDAGWAVGWVYMLSRVRQQDTGQAWWAVRTEGDFWLVSALALTLLSNFMTISPAAYLPLCPDIRHYLFAVPAIGLAAAWGMADWAASPWQPRHLVWPVLSVLCAVLAWFFSPDTVRLYGSLAGVAVLLSVAKARRIVLTAALFWALCLFPLLWKPVRVMRAARDSNYAHQKALVQKHFSPQNPPRRWLVISNQVEKNVDEYLLDFDTTGVRFVAFREVTPARVAAADSVLLLINGTSAYFSGLDWDDMPFWVKQPDPSRRLADTTRHIELFAQHRGDLLRRLEAGK